MIPDTVILKRLKSFLPNDYQVTVFKIFSIQRIVWKDCLFPFSMRFTQDIVTSKAALTVTVRLTVSCHCNFLSTATRHLSYFKVNIQILNGVFVSPSPLRNRRQLKFVNKQDLPSLD